MIFGLSIPAFTFLHTLISLVGIGAGLVLLGAFLAARWAPTTNAIFLVTTILTSVTGFMFPLKTIGPPHIVGAISLVDLAVALVALTVFHRAGRWAAVYTVTAIIALWFNLFVGVVQAFQKVSVLNVYAPTGTEPAFVLTQGVTLLIFVAAGFTAVRRQGRIAAAV